MKAQTDHRKGAGAPASQVGGAEAQSSASAQADLSHSQKLSSGVLTSTGHPEGDSKETSGGQSSALTSASQAQLASESASTSGALDGSSQALQGEELSLEASLSPYLRLASRSPVKWWPWGRAAFEEAKKLNRPVLISIGAGWCHWCRTMDEQTYGSPEIASYLNEHFVAVKVDRDMHPDIDTRYQTAHYLINQKGGGWPLTVFCLSDGRVFDSLRFIGPETQGDRLGMGDILKQVVKNYETNRAELDKRAALVEQNVALASQDAAKAGKIDKTLLQNIYDGIAAQYDKTNGGFGSDGQPKFPNEGALLFLLHYYSEAGEKKALDMVSKTLGEYYKGGLRDHVLGGYFRYAVDGKYQKPRFEKMLYVQSQLLSAFCLTYAATSKTLYKEAAQDILAFCRDTLESREGGFYASQDADIDASDNGSYYTWSASEVESLLGQGVESKIFMHYLNVGSQGEAGGARYVLAAHKPLKSSADAFKLSYSAAQKALDSARVKLREARMNQENVPYVNKSIIASWNALAICAYLDAYKYLKDEQTKAFALKTADFMLANMFKPDQGVAHVFAKGKASVYGLLEDQVQTALALVGCFEVSGDSKYLEAAETLMNLVETKYLDGKSGLYFDRLGQADGSEPGLLKVPQLHIYDSPLPAPNAVGSMAWSRLYLIRGKAEYRDRAKRLIEAVLGQEQLDAMAAGSLGRASMMLWGKAPKVLIIGQQAEASFEKMRETACSVFRMGKLVESMSPEQASQTNYPPSKDGKAIAYVCSEQNCAPPVHDPGKLARLVASFGREKAQEQQPAEEKSDGANEEQ